MATNFTSYLRLAVDSRDVANADKDLRGMASAGDSAAKSTSNLGSVAKRAFGLIAAGISAAKITGYANDWTDLNSRVLNATKSHHNAAQVMDAITKTARTTYSSLQQTAEAYLQNATTLTDLNFSTKEQINLADALNNGLVVSGTKGMQAASVMNALSKAFAEGQLRGDHFNTVIAGGGRLVESIAKEFGVTTVELRKLATEGLLTTSRLVNAFTNDLGNLKSEADAMPATIGDAFQQVDNALFQFVGRLNDVSGAGSSIADIIIGIADSINDLSAALASGQGEKNIQAWVSQWDIAGEAISGVFSQISVFAQKHSVETEGFWSRAFLNLPINLTSAIQIIAVRLAEIIDYAKIYAGAFIDVYKEAFSTLGDLALTAGSVIANNLNPFSERRDFLSEAGEVISENFGRIIEGAKSSATAAKTAADDTVDSIFKTRDSVIQASEKMREEGAALRSDWQKSRGVFEDIEKAAAAAKPESGEERLTEIQKIIAALEEEVIALEIGETAYLAYSLAMKGASEEEIRAAVAAKQRAQEIRKANKTVESETKGLSKAAEQAAERIDTAFASIWTNILNGSTDVFSGIVDGFKSMLAEMAHEAITKPIVLQIQQQMGVGGGGDKSGGAGNAAAGIAAGGWWAAIAAAVVVGVGVHNKEQAAKFAEMTAEVRQARQSTGTLLGYANEKSESIANSIEQLESISRDQLDVNRGMLSALISVRDGIVGVAAGFARSIGTNQGLQVQTGSTLDASRGPVTAAGIRDGLGIKFDPISAPMTNFVLDFGSGLTNKISKEILKKSVKIKDSGISIVGSSMANIIEGSLIKSFNYADVETKKKVFGVTTSTKLKTTEEAIGELFDRQITNVFLSAGEALGEAGKTFGLDIADFANRLVIDTQKISLKDLSAEEVTAELERFLSSTMDKWAQTMIGNTGILEKYQQAGEGAFETMVRVASQTNYLVDAFDQINVALPLTGVAAIEFSQELARMAGGFDALQQSLGTYYDIFFTDQEKLENLTSRLSSATAGLIETLPKTREEFRAIIEALDVTTESGSKAFAELIGLSSAIDKYIAGLEKQADAIERQNREIEQQNAALISSANESAGKALGILKEVIEGQKTGLQGLLDSAGYAKTALDEAINAEKSRLSAISQGAVDALEAQKSSISAIASAQKAGLDDQKSFVQQSIDEMKNLSERLRDSVFSMSEDTPGNSLSRFYEAAGQISGAITGEFTGSLDRAIDTLSGVDRSIFGSQFEAESEIARTQLRMLELADSTDAQISIEERVLKNIESQIAAADRHAANAAAGVDRQIAAAQAALAEELAALDDMAAAAQSQLNALLGIDDGVLSLEEAFAAFEEAVEKGEGVHSQIQLLDELLNAAQSEYNLLSDVSGGINDLNTALENFAVSIRDANIAQGRQSEVQNQNLILELQALRAEQRATAAANAELQRIIANYTRTTAQELENQRRSQNA